jgi:CRP-like cAMP-binding protein
MLLSRISSFFPLGEAERAALAALPLQVTDLRKDQDVVREGDRPTRACIIVEGLACWSKMTGKGQRQITAFCMAGDIPDLQSFHLTELDSTLTTISPCKVAFVRHDALQVLCDEYPQIASAFWRMTLIDSAIFREWVVNVGSRSAYSKLAHVFCELVTRLGVVGLAEELKCDLPITQTQFGDATGLSTVHVNRTIQELRVRKLIAMKGSSFKVLNWEGLQDAGDFDPAYLHITPAQRATH